MTWNLQQAERGVLLGTTGTGKSTLGTEIIRRFHSEYPNGYIFIVDSKPRYRAHYLPNGLQAIYKNWVKGDFLTDSVAVNNHINLKRIFSVFPIVIFQSRTPSGQRVPNFEELTSIYADDLFDLSSMRHPTLFYVDEMYDLARGPGGNVDRELLKTMRAGREKNMAVLAGAQRPKSIPMPLLTEATKYFLFRLKKGEDTDYLRTYGPNLTQKAKGHSFIFYMDESSGTEEKLMELNLAK